MLTTMTLGWIEALDAFVHSFLLSVVPLHACLMYNIAALLDCFVSFRVKMIHDLIRTKYRRTVSCHMTRE